MPFDPSRPIGPDNILWPSDMPVALQHEAEAKLRHQSLNDLDAERVASIQARVKRLERGERDLHVKDWSGAYYGDVYFLLNLLKRQENL